MLTTMPSWRYDRHSKTFVTEEVTSERFDELLHAVIGLGRRPIRLRVQSLSWHQFHEVLEHMHEHSRLEVVEQMSEPPMW